MTKVFIKSKEKFTPEVVQFYSNNFDLVDNEVESDLIVINNFERIETDKIVACNSTGVDHIKAKEVISLRGEDLSDLTAVPELCLGIIIFLMRLRKRKEIRGKTLGLIGYGRIAKQLKKYAECFDILVLCYDKNNSVEELNSILKNSDIISLHITADEENRSFFKKEHFEKMRDDSIFLNSSRPWLVEEQGLKWALENKLNSAWFDFNVSLRHDKLFTTPHLGGSTEESKAKSEMIIAKKLLRLYGSKQ